MMLQVSSKGLVTMPIWAEYHATELVPTVKLISKITISARFAKYGVPNLAFGDAKVENDQLVKAENGNYIPSHDYVLRYIKSTGGEFSVKYWTIPSDLAYQVRKKEDYSSVQIMDEIGKRFAEFLDCGWAVVA